MQDVINSGFHYCYKSFHLSVFLVSAVSNFAIGSFQSKKDASSACTQAIEQLSVAKLDSASTEEQRKRFLAGLDQAFHVYDSTDFECSSSSVLANRRLEYARTLKKDGRFDDALEQLDRLQRESLLTAAKKKYSADVSMHVESSIEFEKGFVLACNGRIDEAIDAQSRSFELASTLFAKPGNTDITEHDVQARMLEIVKLFKWKGGDFAADADDMLREILPTHPQQWPIAHYNDNLAAVAQPWIEDDGARLDEEWAKGVAAIRQWLQEHHDALGAEYTTLLRNGHVDPQQECIHDPRRATWRQHSVSFNISRKAQSGCSTDAFKTTPVVCELLAWITAARDTVSDTAATSASCDNPTSEKDPSVGATPNTHTFPSKNAGKVAVLRVGYSAVSGDAHIRPHTGPTNEQLKLHYGVSIPVLPASPACRWELTVAGQPRAWAERATLLFDDSFEHAVASTCPAPSDHAPERVVLQLVLRHPHLP
eukprot:m.493267 g.493267  ORF g.493267 m.493267 type:complete len:481 (-) comp21792_c0_seq17:2844-4286(-)